MTTTQDTLKLYREKLEKTQDRLFELNLEKVSLHSDVKFCRKMIAQIEEQQKNSDAWKVD